jgi:hypothetical protein
VPPSYTSHLLNEFLAVQTTSVQPPELAEEAVAKELTQVIPR